MERTSRPRVAAPVVLPQEIADGGGFLTNGVEENQSLPADARDLAQRTGQLKLGQMMRYGHAYGDVDALVLETDVVGFSQQSPLVRELRAEAAQFFRIVVEPDIGGARRSYAGALTGAASDIEQSLA